MFLFPFYVIAFIIFPRHNNIKLHIWKVHVGTHLFRAIISTEPAINFIRFSGSKTRTPTELYVKLKWSMQVTRMHACKSNKLTEQRPCVPHATPVSYSSHTHSLKFEFGAIFSRFPMEHRICVPVSLSWPEHWLELPWSAHNIITSRSLV